MSLTLLMLYNSSFDDLLILKLALHYPIRPSVVNVMYFENNFILYLGWTVFPILELREKVSQYFTANSAQIPYLLFKLFLVELSV